MSNVLGNCVAIINNLASFKTCDMKLKSTKIILPKIENVFPSRSAQGIFYH